MSTSGPHRPRYFSDHEIACVCHQMITGLQMVLDDPAPSPPWLVYPPADQAIVATAVRAVKQGASPPQLHELWMVLRAEQGCTFGLIKGDDTHPNMIPWEDLDRGQQLKDELFQLVTAYMASVQL